MLKSGQGVTAEYAIGSEPATVLGLDTQVTSAPVTLRLERSGKTFSEYEFKAGAWVQLGAITLPGAESTLYVGFEGSSDNAAGSQARETLSTAELLNYAE